MNENARKCKECGKKLNSNKCDCGWQDLSYSAEVKPFQICDHVGCNKNGKDIAKTNNVYFCNEHWEDWVLKKEDANCQNQIQAKRIRLARKYIEEAKEAGMTGREYFAKCHPSWVSKLATGNILTNGKIVE